MTNPGFKSLSLSRRVLPDIDSWLSLVLSNTSGIWAYVYSFLPGLLRVLSCVWMCGSVFIHLLCGGLLLFRVTPLEGFLPPPCPFVGPLYACRYVCFSPSPLEMKSWYVSRIGRAICLEGHLFGGPYLFSRDLLPFLATMHIVSSYSYVYILFMRTRYMDIYTHVLEGSENGNTM